MSIAAASSWRDRLTAYLQQEARPHHKYGHQARLYVLARQIALGSPGFTFDDDILFAAAYLHDLGVFVGHRPEDPQTLRSWDHVAYACQHAPDLLQNMGFPREKVPTVLSCIREHQPHDSPSTPEATLLRDADILEQLGALGILRTASKLGSDTRYKFFADVQHSLNRALHTLPSKLRLPAAHTLAQSRIASLAAFLQALEAEAGEHLG